MISVVMCSRSQTNAQASARMYAAALAGVEHEVIPVIAAPSMCVGYNEGVRRSKGDIVIFSHDDIEILGDDFAPRLMAHLEHVDLVGIAGTSHLAGPQWFTGGLLHAYGQAAHGNPQTGAMTVNIFHAPSRRVEGIQALDGAMMAARRAVLDRVTFDETIPGFHLYDLDFSYCAFRAGFKLGIACDLYVLHWSHGGYNSPEWVAAARAFMNKHGAHFPTLSLSIKVTSREEALEALRKPHPVEVTIASPAQPPVPPPG